VVQVQLDLDVGPVLRRLIVDGEQVAVELQRFDRRTLVTRGRRQRQRRRREACT
jgi:hypothetical protein